jgi:GR25 family glycosyltransferase involved in LPS biosynthesis
MIILMVARYMLRSLRKNQHNQLNTKKFPIYIINLNHRVDRKKKVLAQFRNMNFKAQVYKATYKSNGALGCAISHFFLLDSLISSPVPIMICEDDIEFTVNRQKFDTLILEFLQNQKLDVLCIANKSRFPISISENLAISYSIQTTACYLVKPHAIKFLAESAASSVSNLEAGRSAHRFALDQRWKKLQQRKLIFSIPRDLYGFQSASWSDIESAFMDYKA